MTKAVSRNRKPKSLNLSVAMIELVATFAKARGMTFFRAIEFLALSSLPWEIDRNEPNENSTFTNPKS